jgi:hypothetical protein
MAMSVLVFTVARIQPIVRRRNYGDTILNYVIDMAEAG